MDYEEDKYLMLSGIQHFKFCRRQWALIHIEQQWAENVHTAVGELLHKRVHDPVLKEKRKGLITARALPVFSRSLGVSGECDVVEFCPCEEGIQLRGHRGTFSVYPVEYKKRISYSSQHRRCVWKKCFQQKFRKGRFFTGKQEEGNLLRLQRSFGQR